MVTRPQLNFGSPTPTATPGAAPHSAPPTSDSDSVSPLAWPIPRIPSFLSQLSLPKPLISLSRQSNPKSIPTIAPLAKVEDDRKQSHFIRESSDGDGEKTARPAPTPELITRPHRSPSSSLSRGFHLALTPRVRSDPAQGVEIAPRIAGSRGVSGNLELLGDSPGRSSGRTIPRHSLQTTVQALTGLRLINRLSPSPYPSPPRRWYTLVPSPLHTAQPRSPILPRAISAQQLTLQIDELEVEWCFFCELAKPKDGVELKEVLGWGRQWVCKGACKARDEAGILISNQAPTGAGATGEQQLRDQ